MSHDTQDRVNDDINEFEQRLLPDNDDQFNTTLEFRVASTLEHVIEAWRLVYSTYRRIDLIDPNPHRLHTTATAPQPASVVIIGCIRKMIVSTLTCIRDTEVGLPLDREYKHELDTLRAQGRRITEIGLLADRRQSLARAADSLFMMMRYAHDYSFRDGGTDVVLGVHPRHARFYNRAFGTEIYGSERTYAAVKSKPVVLLRLGYESQNTLNPPPRGLRYFRDNAVPEDMYDGRYEFAKDQMATSPIGEFLAHHHA